MLYAGKHIREERISGVPLYLSLRCFAYIMKSFSFLFFKSLFWLTPLAVRLTFLVFHKCKMLVKLNISL